VVTWSTGYSRARSQVLRSTPPNVVPARVNRSSQSAKPRLCTSPVSALDSPFIDDRPAWSDSTQCPSQSSSIAGLRDMSRSKSFQSAFAHSSIRNHGPAPATQLRDQGLTEVVPCAIQCPHSYGPRRCRPGAPHKHRRSFKSTLSHGARQTQICSDSSNTLTPSQARSRVQCTGIS